MNEVSLKPVTPEQRLNSLIDFLINGRVGEIYRYRKMVW